MTKDLFSEPYAFDFYQAVRLLERDGQPVGRDAAPSDEAVRLRSQIAHGFSPNEISTVEHEGDGPPVMTVPFMGLVGPNGVLPLHYTTLILERLRQRDSTLRDFFDLFNHRLLAHMYRAWEKNHFPFAYERNRKDRAVDLFTECVYCLVGRGTEGQRERRSVNDEAFAFYAGQFSQRVRSATSLEMVLADYVGLPLKIEEFVGQWLYLGEVNQSYLSGEEDKDDCNCQLGLNVVLGERVWDIQSKFRIRIGPLTYPQFFAFTPTQQRLAEVVELARSFVGPEFDFDVQLVLGGDQVPQCVLGSAGDASPRLGWNTWIQSATDEREVSDAVFGSEEL